MADFYGIGVQDREYIFSIHAAPNTDIDIKNYDDTAKKFVISTNGNFAYFFANPNELGKFEISNNDFTINDVLDKIASGLIECSYCGSDGIYEQDCEYCIGGNNECHKCGGDGVVSIETEYVENKQENQ